MYTFIPISRPSCISLPPTLPIPPLQVVTKHRADLPVLCGCFPLAIYFTFGSVYKSMPLSHFITTYPSPSLCPQGISIERNSEKNCSRFQQGIHYLCGVRYNTNASAVLKKTPIIPPFLFSIFAGDGFFPPLYLFLLLLLFFFFCFFFSPSSSFRSNVQRIDLRAGAKQTTLIKSGGH